MKKIEVTFMVEVEEETTADYVEQVVYNALVEDKSIKNIENSSHRSFWYPKPIV